MRLRWSKSTMPIGPVTPYKGIKISQVCLPSKVKSSVGSSHNFQIHSPKGNLPWGSIIYHSKRLTWIPKSPIWPLQWVLTWLRAWPCDTCPSTSVLFGFRSSIHSCQVLPLYYCTSDTASFSSFTSKMSFCLDVLLLLLLVVFFSMRGSIDSSNAAKLNTSS